MKKIIFMLVLFMFPIINASCLNFNINETIEEEKNVDGSSIIIGNNIESKNSVHGIDAMIGNNINFNGISDYLFLIGNNINVNGNVSNDGIIIGNVIKFDSNVVVDRDLVIVGSEVIIDGTIKRDVKIYAMNVTINGNINGNVDIKSSDIKVNGNIDGVLSYNEDAVIKNKGNVNEFNITEKMYKDITFQDRVWQFIINYGSLLLIFLFFAFITPKLFKRIEHKNEKLTILNFFSLFGFGTLSVILIPIIFILLLTLVFGTSLAILLLIFYIVCIWLSSLFTSYLIGYLVWKNIIKKDNNIYLIGLIGISIISVLSIIPFIGSLISVISIFVGMGIILQQLKKD